MKDKLKHGDLTRIAEATGFTQNYVARVLSYNDRKNSEIEKVAQELIKQREGLKNNRKK